MGLLMADITILPGFKARPSRWHADWTCAGMLLTRHRWLLLFMMLFALGWSTIEASDKSQDCNTRWGQFNWKEAHWLGDAECRQPQSDALPQGVP